MVKVRTAQLTKEELLSIMKKPESIRNVCLFASDDFDKSAITDALVASSSFLMTPEATAGLLDQANESPPGFPEWSDVALYCELGEKSAAGMGKMSADSPKDNRKDNKFLLNIIDTPLHAAEPSVEFSSSLCIGDGALLVVNCSTGIDSNVESFLQHALHENIVPILCLDLMDDSSLLGYGGTGEDVYETLFSYIERCNQILEKYQGKLLGDIKFHPPKGNVVFSCCSGQWGFTLSFFAELWANKFGLEPAELVENLWGGNFFDYGSQKWTKQHTGSQWCQRGFVHFCYDTVQQVINCCKQKNFDALSEIFDYKKKLGKKINVKQITGDDLAKLVMRNWVPIATTLIDTVVMHIPSPSKAQKYRVENMYHGPLNDHYAEAFRSCSCDDPPIMYVSKIVQSPESGQLLSVARLFTGKLSSGSKVRIIDSKDGHKRKCTVKIFRGAVIRLGQKEEFVETISCGNVFAVSGFLVSGTTVILRDKILSGSIRPISVTLMKNEIVEDVILKDQEQRKEKNLNIPYSIYNTLYPHQREGVHWLWSRHCKKDGGCILADDMGLGKTRQVSAFLCGLFHTKLIQRALVIAPSSVIDHWKPELKEVGLNSSKFDKSKDPSNLSLKSVSEIGGVLLTSYDAYRIHENLILKYIGDRFDYVFADEGHTIKNADCKRTQAMLRIKCAHKIILTGTPVQNNLKEFHSLMLFTSPRTCVLEEFQKNFIVPIDRGKHKGADLQLMANSSHASEKLKIIIEPLLLRRTKDILKSSGRFEANKFEVVVWLKISALQRILYKAIAAEKLLKRGDGGGLGAAIVAEDICNHPLLAISNKEAFHEDNHAARFREYLHRFLLKHQKVSCIDKLQPDSLVSNKLEFLMHIVPALLDEKHCILIFSTSPQMLKLIQDALVKITEKDNIICMDGTTSSKDRLKLVNYFQTKTGPSIFLMTTKVGGFGITLTKASRVIIFDPSDNPCDDNQAVDRAYRIGQEKDVVVYRLLTCSTVEEHRYRQQVLKVETSCAILEKKQCKRQITKKEGYVVKDPEVGFDVSLTHQELAEIHPNLDIFDQSLNSELQLVKEPDYVYDIANHSAMYASEEDLAPANEYESQTEQHVTKAKKNLTEKNFIQLKKTVPQKLVPYLKSGKLSKEKSIQRVSGATIKISHSGDVTITGYGDHVANAEKLLQVIVDETVYEELKIKWEEAGAIIGTGGAKIAEMRSESGAYIEVSKIKNNDTEKVVIITGTNKEVGKAIDMVKRRIKGKMRK